MRNANVVGEEDEGRVGALRACAGGGCEDGGWVCLVRKRGRGGRKRMRPFFLDGMGERGPLTGAETLGCRIVVRRENFISLGPLSHTLSAGKEDLEGKEVDGGMGNGTTV
jgi:hypothetical protein